VKWATLGRESEINVLLDAIARLAMFLTISQPAQEEYPASSLPNKREEGNSHQGKESKEYGELGAKYSSSVEADVLLLHLVRSVAR
jgi:hypothetical protein